MAEKVVGFRIEVKGSEQIVKTIGELEKIVKDTNKQLKNTEVGTKEYDRLNKQLAVAKDQLADVRKTQRLAVKEAEGVRAASGSYKELNAELITLKDNFRRLGREAREGIGGQRLIKRIQELDAELKDLDKSIGQSFRNVGNYASAFEGLGGAIGGNIGTLAALVTGKAGLEEAVGLIIDGAAAVGELVAEFAMLRGEIERLTGATGGELDEFTTRIGAIANTFGVTTEEVLQSANALTNQLTGDFSESLTAIEQGFVAGANANGEFLDSLSEYSTQAQAAGLDTAEFISILNQSAREGVFSDKGIDAVKEFGLRIREQTKPTRDALDAAFGADFTNELFENINTGVTSTADALKIVTTRLKESNLPANELQTVITDVFGGAGEDAGQAFLEVLSDINTDINALEGSTSDYARQQEQLLAVNQQLAAASNELAKELAPVGNFFQRIGTQIGAVLLKTLSLLIQSLKFVGNAFITFGDGIAGVIRNIPVLGAGFDFIADRAAIVGRFFTEQLPAAFAGFQAAAGQVVQNVSSLFQRLTLSAQIAGKSINANLAIRSDTRERLRKEIEDLKQQREAAASAAGSIGEAFNEAFNKAIAGDGQQIESPIAKVFDPNAIDIKPVITQIDEVGVAANKATTDVEELNSALKDLGRPLEELKTQEVENIAEIGQARKDDAASFFESLQKQAEDSRDFSAEQSEEEREREKKEREERQQAAINAGNELLATAASISDAIKVVRLKKLDEELQERLKSVKGNEAEEARITEEFEKRREQIEIQAAKRSKAIQTASAIINGAAAIVRNFADVPYPFSLVTAALIAAQTGAQIAVINAQKFARGGVLSGASHANGGIPAMVGSTPVELEGGEAVINKRSTAMFKPLLSRINEAGGGLKFQGGGVLPTPNIRSAAEPFTAFNETLNAIREENKATQNLALAVQNQVVNLNVNLDTDELEGVQNTKVALDQARTL